MKAVILSGDPGLPPDAAGGHPPDAMIGIGGRPVLWHLMKMYDAHGISDFIVCCATGADVVRDFFADYGLHVPDITFDLGQASVAYRQPSAETWRVTVVDTSGTAGAGRGLTRVSTYLEGEDAFCFTYGDSLASIDIGASIAFHRTHGQPATLCAVRPPARHGALKLDGTEVRGVSDRVEGEDSLVNGGFFVLSPDCLAALDADSPSLDGEPLKRLAAEGRLRAYRHEGFWQPMDTLRDRNHLESLWHSGAPPWKVW